MWRWSLLGLALFCLPSAIAHDRQKTVSLERLWGFEYHLLVAAMEMEFPIPLLPAGEDGDYRVYLSPRFANAEALRMYRKSTGRTEDSILELYDPRTRRSHVTLVFQMERDEASRRRVAREFLRKIWRHVSP
jgi:hypothetical protein